MSCRFLLTRLFCSCLKFICSGYHLTFDLIINEAASEDLQKLHTWFLRLRIKDVSAVVLLLHVVTLLILCNPTFAFSPHSSLSRLVAQRLTAGRRSDAEELKCLCELILPLTLKGGISAPTRPPRWPFPWRRLIICGGRAKQPVTYFGVEWMINANGEGKGC